MKRARLAELQALLEEQRQAFNRHLIGATLPVLFEKKGRRPGQIAGRSPYLQAVQTMAPDHLIGEIAPVEIIAVGANSLFGKLVPSETEPKARFAQRAADRVILGEIEA